MLYQSFCAVYGHYIALRKQYVWDRWSHSCSISRKMSNTCEEDHTHSLRENWVSYGSAVSICTKVLLSGIQPPYILVSHLQASEPSPFDRNIRDIIFALQFTNHDLEFQNRVALSAYSFKTWMKRVMSVQKLRGTQTHTHSPAVSNR